MWPVGYFTGELGLENLVPVVTINAVDCLHKQGVRSKAIRREYLVGPRSAGFVDSPRIIIVGKKIAPLYT